MSMSAFAKRGTEFFASSDCGKSLASRANASFDFAASPCAVYTVPSITSACGANFPFGLFSR